MSNTLFAFVVAVLSINTVTGFLFDIGQFECEKGDQAYKGCFDCLCHHQILKCVWCGGQCKDKHLERQCSDQSPTTTKPPVTHSSDCNEFKVFEAVALMQYVNNTSGDRCPDGTHHNYDALVMSLCSAPQRSGWIDGEHVWANNHCSQNIKPFTPVYLHNGSLKIPSVLLSCTDSEIRVFYQNCDNTPRVYHIKDHSTMSKIYAITWV